MSHTVLLICAQIVKYFSATPPDQVVEKLVVSPILNTGSGSGAFPDSFVFDEAALDTLIAKEKQSVNLKIKNMRNKMKELGLDHLMADLSRDEDSSPEAGVIPAVYGDYIADRK